MPGEGPAPIVTTPMVSGHTGSLGPTSMAQGVSGDFSGNVPQVPNWGQTSTLLGAAAGAAGVAIGKKLPDAKIYRNPLSDEERGSGQKWVTRQSRKDLKAYKNTKATEDPWVQSERDLDEGVVRVLSPAEQSQRITIGGRSIQRPGTYDPSLAGTGASINDINRDFGMPMVGAAGELEGPRPSAESQWREPESGGTPPSYEDIATRRRGSDPIPQGPIKFAGELEQVAGVRREQPVTEAPQPRRTPPGTGRAVSPRTTAGTEAEPRVAEMSVGYEYPGYNARLGDNPQPRKRPTTRSGRRGLAAEREATRDPNQYSLFDPNQ
jgi:hypothetical protein